MSAINAIQNHDALVTVIDRAALASAFEIVNQVIEPRNTIPILSNARIQGDDDYVFITGTDSQMDLEITARITVHGDNVINTTIPAKQMQILLKGSPKVETVTFKDDGEGTVGIDFGKSRYSLKSIDPVDFPAMTTKTEFTYQFDIPGNEWRDGLESVAGAMSDEPTRYYMRGVFMTETHDGELRFVASDGHRLYCQDIANPGTVKLPEGSGAHAGVIIPRKTVEALLAVTKGKKCPRNINVRGHNSQIRFEFEFEFGFVTIISKLIDGTFPDYSRVVPRLEGRNVAGFNSVELLEAVKSASLISPDKRRAVKIRLSQTASDIVVRNPDTGNSESSVSADWNGEDFEIGVNAQYLAEAVNTANSADIQISFGTSDDPILITGSKAGWQGVIMPMRV